MRYLLAVFGDSSTWGTQSDEEARAELDAFAAFEREAAGAGVLRAQEALQPEGRTFSRRDGAAEVADGALTAPEQRLGCFYVLECRDLDEATEWASKIPLVGAGGFDSVEIRPLIE